MRSKQFNVSPDVYEAYWALAKMEAGDDGLCHHTPDEIADSVLCSHINFNHPTLWKKLNARKEQMDAIDKQLIEELNKPTPTEGNGPEWVDPPIEIDKP